MIAPNAKLACVSVTYSFQLWVKEMLCVVDRWIIYEWSW